MQIIPIGDIEHVQPVDPIGHALAQSLFDVHERGPIIPPPSAGGGIIIPPPSAGGGIIIPPSAGGGDIIPPSRGGGGGGGIIIPPPSAVVLSTGSGVVTQA